MLANSFLTIRQYSSNSVTLSNETIVTENFYLYNDTFKTIDQKIENNNDFLNNINTYHIINTLPFSPDIIVIGCGAKFIIPSLEVKAYFSSKKIGCEWVVSPSAFHIYNILVEERKNIFGLFLINS